MDLEAKVADLHKRLSVIENERGVLHVWPGEVRDTVHLGKPASEVECKATNRVPGQSIVEKMPYPTAPNAVATDNPLYRVGDLVEVVEKFGSWFYVGERFFVHRVEGDDIIRRDKMRIASEQVRLISRP